mmetsp:Transcript_13535/g.22642  ORF Transcript_13535/g.22642 Transcript_13535/m.22642 type:complete len:1253 (-) Transcript_13535:348-4106(-)
MGIGSSLPEENAQLGKSLLSHINFKGKFTKEHEEQARQAFACYDMDKSGMLERKEAEKFLSDLKALQIQRGVVTSDQGNELVAAAMKKIDQNSDGMLSFEEFFGAEAVFENGEGKGKSKGKYMEIYGLKDMTKYNGVRGISEGPDQKETERIKMTYRVGKGNAKETILINPENIRPAYTRVYAFRFTQARGSAKSLALGGIQFRFMNWGDWIEKKFHTTAATFTGGQVFTPIHIENPGGSNKNGTLHNMDSLRPPFVYGYQEWRDFAWKERHQSTLIFTFVNSLGPLLKYRFRTSSSNKWRDPTVWTLHSLNQITGDWDEIHNVSYPFIPDARRQFYATSCITYNNNKNKIDSSSSTSSSSKKQKEKKEKSIFNFKKQSNDKDGHLALPSNLPDLSRQQSFEPVTMAKTTWQLITLERQKSTERNQAGLEIINGVAANHHLFLKENKKKNNNMMYYLPRVVPPELMELKGTALILIAEYADLSLSRWNTAKKGQALYKDITSKALKINKGVSSRNSMQKQVQAVTKDMEDKMKKVFNLSNEKVMSNDICAAAASYLQLLVLLEVLDIHYSKMTGKTTSRQEKLKNIEKERKAAEQEEKKRKREQELLKKKKQDDDNDGKKLDKAEEATTKGPEVIVVKKAVISGISYNSSASSSSGNAQSGGIGYGGAAGIDTKARKAIADKKKEQKITDGFSELLLRCIVTLLAETKTHEISIDKHKEELLLASLNPYLANYLRSSFMQIAERQPLYLAVLKTCEAVALDVGVEILEKNESAGRADIISLLGSIKRQVSVYITSSLSSSSSSSPGGEQKTTTTTTDADMIKVSEFAAEVDRIIAAILTQHKTLIKSRRKSGKKVCDAGSSSSSSSNNDETKLHNNRMQTIAVNMIDLMSSKVTHTFKKDAERSPPPPKVIRRLTQEIGSLMTGLPYGIFLRVDNSRMDLMRACIMAPGDAPYENGVFFFDIWVPSNYPAAPPKCKIITTNRATVRFNPNLYNNGKVCLSLLGTWSGPGWDPSYSNILQVLLSIQSMILGAPEPIVNEPGWVRDLGTARSRGYNSYLMCRTVMHAMHDHLYWLRMIKNPKELEEEEKKRLKDMKQDPGAPKFGKPTYINNRKQTSVTTPWKMSKDDKSGKWYFWNPVTGQSQWHRPYSSGNLKLNGVTRSPLEGFTEVLSTHFWLKKRHILETQLPFWESHLTTTVPTDPYGGSGVRNLKWKEEFAKLKKLLTALEEPEIEAEDDDDDGDEDEEEESDQDDY